MARGFFSKAGTQRLTHLVQALRHVVALEYPQGGQGRRHGDGTIPEAAGQEYPACRPSERIPSHRGGYSIAVPYGLRIAGHVRLKIEVPVGSTGMKTKSSPDVVQD